MIPIRDALIAAAHCLNNGRPADTKTICGRILAVDAGNTDALHLWGLAARQEGDLGEAVRLLSKAVASKPLFDTAWINLGNALRAAGRHDEARRVHRVAVAVAPQAVSVWHALGAFLLREGGSGSRDEAIATLRRAVTLEPGAAEALHDLGLALRYAERTDEGIAALKAATSANADFAMAYMNLGTALVEDGEHQRAVGALARAVMLAPNSGEVHYNDGNVRHAAGDLEGAHKAFRRAVASGLAMARTRLAMVLHDLGRLDEAEAVFMRTLTDGGDIQTAIEQLTRIFIESGRIVAGQEFFAGLIQTSPVGRIHRGECLTAIADLDLRQGQVGRAALLLKSVRGDGGRFFTVKSVAALRLTLAREGLSLRRPTNPDPGRPAVTSITLASHGRFAHNVLEYVLVRLYAEKHGFTLETPEWVGGYYFQIDDPLPSRPYRPFYYPRKLLNRHLDGTARGAPMAGVDFRSPLFLIDRKEEYRERVQSWLKPRALWSRHVDPAMERLRALGDTVVAIHIRRGDFVGFRYPITETAWYVAWLRALWPTLARPVLYVASDDLAGVRADFAEFAPVSRADIAPDWPDLEFLQDFHVLMNADVVGISAASGYSLLAAQLNTRARLFVEPDMAERRIRPFAPWGPPHPPAHDLSLVCGVPAP